MVKKKILDNNVIALSLPLRKNKRMGCRNDDNLWSTLIRDISFINYPLDFIFFVLAFIIWYKLREWIFQIYCIAA